MQTLNQFPLNFKQVSTNLINKIFQRNQKFWISNSIWVSTCMQKFWCKYWLLRKNRKEILNYISSKSFFFCSGKYLSWLCDSFLVKHSIHIEKYWLKHMNLKYFWIEKFCLNFWCKLGETGVKNCLEKTFRGTHWFKI